MNDQLRVLRLKEIEPLKQAMMNALDRAQNLSPPLHKHGEHGMVPVNDLKLAIDRISIGDAELRDLMARFAGVCGNADKAWFAEVHSINPEHHSRDAIKAKYVDNHNGKKFAEAVKNEYDALSRHLEKLLG